MISFIPHFLVVEIPKVIPLIILLGLLIAGIAEFRKGYIGRIAIFLNALLLWQIFYGAWANLPNYFQGYLNIGSVIGLIALITYIPKISLPTYFYKFAYVFYGSISIIIAIFGAIYFKIPLF